ncbi:hypothetical protein L1987_47928 [Smallanthus sonchifolius]|uniref:Uncharacterized protein n=1 Tax=Smallanthus sonchifolius TaxID=185202 RepID=A0ACB9FRD6_9ASTR|nr:hypothetical protein L1987_47928 [Smallanthus sonchifolius]
MAEVVVSLETALAIQEQFNYSLQSAGQTIFGRMVNMFAFSGHSVQGDSSNSKGNNRSVRADYSHLSIKSNIYSFGVVLLESLTGRHSVILADDVPHNLVNQVSQAKSNRRKLKKIMDPRLEDNYSLQGASECLALALRCLERKPKDRPSSASACFALALRCITEASTDRPSSEEL